MLTTTEENYLKALFHLSAAEVGKKNAGINELAIFLDLRPATCNEMCKRLKEKQLVDYERYGKVSLTEEGKHHAIVVIRKHRLWETFLYEKLHFTWDEVHEVAEQLEHIQSVKLIDRLDEFLSYPRYDPHGDPIPDAKGYMLNEVRNTLADITTGEACKMVGVKDNSAPFLQHVARIGLSLGTDIRVNRLNPFDHTVEINVNCSIHTISRKFAEHILVV
jgi:DtxR family Mn-dependent transcriptional regulator